MYHRRMALLIIGLFPFLAGCVCAQDASASLFPKTLRLIISQHGKERSLLEDEITLTPEQLSWHPPESFHLPFAKLTKVSFTKPRKADSSLMLMADFIFEGEENHDRQILVDVVAMDQQGQSIFHEWDIQEDGRLRQDDIIRTVKASVSKSNHTKFKITRDSFSKTASLRIIFREVYSKDLSHFPSRPEPLKLAITEPDSNGLVYVSFCNPEGINVDPSRDGIVIVLNVLDANQVAVDKIVKSYDAQCLKKGERYKFALAIDSRYYDYSSVKIVFYTKQPDNEAFLQKFFIDGKGAAYSGMWYSEGNKLLWRIPLESFYK